MEDIEDKGNADYRRENLAGVRGRVIELGAGTGLNFAHYGAEVSELVATEPEPYMRQRAQQAAAEAPIPVTVVDWPAEALDAPDASFDVAIACLVLCCVRDQRRALDERFRSHGRAASCATTSTSAPTRRASLAFRSPRTASDSRS